MTSSDKDGYRRQRESERAWLGKPLTTGWAIALLGVNLLGTLVVVVYLG